MGIVVMDLFVQELDAQAHLRLRTTFSAKSVFQYLLIQIYPKIQKMKKLKKPHLVGNARFVIYV